jgi:hypothetical protein
VSQSQKQYITQMINNFQQNVKQMPDDLEAKLEQIKAELAHISEDELELGANGAVTTTASEQSLQSNHPVYLLRDAYSEMEHIAYSEDFNEEVHSVILQMRGYLGIADRYWP